MSCSRRVFCTWARCAGECLGFNRLVIIDGRLTFAGELYLAGEVRRLRGELSKQGGERMSASLEQERQSFSRETHGRAAYRDFCQHVPLLCDECVMLISDHEAWLYFMTVFLQVVD